MPPLMLLLLLFSVQEAPPAEASISGTVTDSLTGVPLSKVRVLAEPADHDSPDLSTTTDDKGRFSLVHVRPGEYRLRGMRNGYLETYYGARRPGARGITLHLDPGSDQKQLPLKLFPFAVVAGTVRDPEGEPLVGARVTLIAITYRDGFRQLRAVGYDGTTDDLGQYRIPNVRPGHYYVKAAPGRDDDRAAVDHSPRDASPPQELVPAFYPAARDAAGARKIELAAGDRFTGADVTLMRSRLFRVRVKLQTPPGVESGISLEPRPNLGDGFGPNPPSECKPGGLCEFARVPSGSYSAIGQANPRQGFKMTVEEMFSNSVRTYASTPVEVTNADVEGVVVTLTAPAEIDGHFVGDHEHARVTFTDSDGGGHQARFAEDGSFTALLSPGKYSVEVSAAGDLIPKAIRSEQTDVLRDGLTVSRPGKLPLEIVMAHGGAKVEGVVKDKDDQPVAGAIVVLVPEPGLRFRHDLFLDGNTDQLGRYHFDSVTPGEYKIFVWPDVEEGIWFDPDFLKEAESQGQSVSVDPKGHVVVALVR